MSPDRTVTHLPVTHDDDPDWDKEPL